MRLIFFKYIIMLTSFYTKSKLINSLLQYIIEKNENIGSWFFSAFFYQRGLFFEVSAKNSIKKIQIYNSYLSSKYALYRNEYSLLGESDEKYLWMDYTESFFQVFQIRKTRFLHKQFFYFYFLPGFGLLQKEGIYTYLLALKKKISLFKKSNTLKKAVLFKVGSRSWKNFVFTRSYWEEDSQELSLEKTESRATGNKYGKFKQYLNTEMEYPFEPSYKEFNIKSRFNRIFFENRKIFAFIFNKKNLRQKRFTNLYSNWLKKNWIDILMSFELSLKNLLLRSRFVFTDAQCEILFANKFVFVNGSHTTNRKLKLGVGDRIQLLLANDYYHYFQQILSDMIYIKKFLSARVWRLVRFNDNVYKQTARNVPDWVLLMSYFFLDIPHFLEVDYVILTTIVLYKPQFGFDFNYIVKKFMNLFLLRLYNWRYIV